MRFDLTDLRLFLNVIEAGSITVGADRSCIALAAASARVRGMEEELGVPLLERGRRGIVATPAGLTLAHHARSVLQQVAEMRGALGQYSRGLKAEVTLLCNTAALTEFLPNVLGPFLARNPNIDIELQEFTSIEIVRQIVSGKADLGIVSDSADLLQLQTRPFQVDRLVAVMPRQHPLAGRKSLYFSDFIQLPFVGLLKGSAIQDHLDSQAERLGTRIGYRIRVHDFASVCQLVKDEVGVAIVSETSAVRCSKGMAIAYVPLAESWARRELTLCSRNFEELPVHYRQLAESIVSPPHA